MRPASPFVALRPLQARGQLAGVRALRWLGSGLYSGDLPKVLGPLLKAKGVIIEVCAGLMDFYYGVGEPLGTLVVYSKPPVPENQSVSTKRVGRVDREWSDEVRIDRKFVGLFCFRVDNARNRCGAS